jgi:hypothetical protein
MDWQQRRACYQSQLPKLLAGLIGTGSGAYHDIAVILGYEIGKLDDVLFEQDIPPVSWIAKPNLNLAINNDIASTADMGDHDIQGSLASRLSLSSSSQSTLVSEMRGLSIVRSSATYGALRETPAGDHQRNLINAVPEQYSRLVDQVVRSAQRTADPSLEAQSDDSDEHEVFNHVETFGRREANEFTHDRRVGAVGEAYVRIH